MAPDPSQIRALLDRAAGPEGTPEDTERARAEMNALFASHAERLYRMCRRFVSDPEQARELAQDVLVVAVRRFGEFRPGGSFSAWLYGIARFTCLRALSKRRELLTDDGIFDLADPAASALRALRRQERHELLHRVSAEVLTPLEQEVVYLRYSEGMDQDAITRLLALEEKSGARGVLQRCRRKLARALRERLAEIGCSSSFFEESHG